MVFRGQWQSQYVQYNCDDVVEYQGQYFKIREPHKSQSDWPPTATPALWEGVDGSQFQGCQAQDHPPVYHSQDQPRPAPNVNGFAPKQGGSYTMPNGQDVHHEETKKPWYDVGDDKKKEILMGGGLALGLGLLGGGLYMAHEKHEKKEGKGREAQAWELQNWVLKAQQHTDNFFRNGPDGPVTWILSDAFASHEDLLSSAIRAGEEDGQPWFIARAPYSNSLQVGKARLQRGSEYAFIGYGNDSIQVKRFEVLIGAPNRIKWVEAHKNLNASSLEYEPVVGGHDSDGSKIYVARVSYKGAVHPGKCSASLKGGYFCYGDHEKSEDNYEVLCIAKGPNY